MANKAKRGKPKQKKSGGILALAIVGIMVLGVGFLGYQYITNPGKDGAFTSQRVPGGERRPTLDPTLFTGSVARAYQVAREIPEVLDKLYCHCQCIENSGHFSNLSCFVDRHGAGWDVCVETALVASEMTKQGKSIPEIQAELDRRFAK